MMSTAIVQFLVASALSLILAKLDGFPGFQFSAGVLDASCSYVFSAFRHRGLRTQLQVSVVV